MWPTTLHAEKTYRFFKNVYDHYGSNGSSGRKRSVSEQSSTESENIIQRRHSRIQMHLEQEQQIQKQQQHQQQRRTLKSSRHGTLASPGTFSSSSSALSETSSPPSTVDAPAVTSSSSSMIVNRNKSTLRKIPSMTRLVRFSKSVAHDVRHRFSLTRLAKVDSTESEESKDDDECRIVGNSISPQPSSFIHHEPIHQHTPLYYRASSPVFENRHHYATTSRLHQSEPHNCGARRSTETLSIGTEYMKRSSPTPSSGKASTSRQFTFGETITPSEARRLSYRRPSTYDPIISSSSDVDQHVDSSSPPSSIVIGDDDDDENDGVVVSVNHHHSNGARTVLLEQFHSTQPKFPICGMKLCGGPEVGLPNIYVSRVVPNSPADKCGISSGDQIISANYVSFLKGDITLKRAYEIISNGLPRNKSNNCTNGIKNYSILLTYLPKRIAFAPNLRRHHQYAWNDPDGRPVSPPPSDRVHCSNNLIEDQQFTRYRRAPPLRELYQSKTSSSKVAQFASKHTFLSEFKRKVSIPGEIRTVTITLEKGIDLGLIIRGGIEYGLGIYVARISANSLAENANLSVGDQILSVNEYDFTDVLHDEAVEILQSDRRLVMKVMYIGKVPSCTYLATMDSARHSSQSRYYSSSTSPMTIGSDHHTYGSSSSTKTSPHLLQHHSPQHHLQQQQQQSQQKLHRLDVLSHTNSNPITTSPKQYNHRRVHQTQSYRNIGTPTLLITDSDNHDMPANLIDQDDDDDVDDDDDEMIRVEMENELYRLTVDRGERYHHLRRRRLQNTKSEEDDATLDEECAKYLNDKERLTLAYYRNEYVTKAMSIETLVALLSELFDTNEKYSIMFRLYHIIRPEDVNKYDKLIYHRERHETLKEVARLDVKYKHLFRQESTDSNNTFDCPNINDPIGGLGPGPPQPPPLLPPQSLRLRSNSSASNHDPYMNHSMVNHPHHHHHQHLPLQPHQPQDDYHLGLQPCHNRLSRSAECQLMHSPLKPSPNSAAYRKQFMARRHSSGTSDTPIIRDISSPTNVMGHHYHHQHPHHYHHLAQHPGNNDHHHVGNMSIMNHSSAMAVGGKTLSAYGSYPMVSDERRWSISAPEYHRPSTLFTNQPIQRAPSPAIATTSATNLSQPFQCTNDDIDGQMILSNQRLAISRKGSSASCCSQTGTATSGQPLPPPPPPPPLGTSATTLAMQSETMGNDQTLDGNGQPISVNLSSPSTTTTANIIGNPLASVSAILRGSGNHLHVPSMNDDIVIELLSDDVDPSQFPNHQRVRRHRSLPSPTFSNFDKQFNSESFAQQHQRSSSFRLPNHRTSTMTSDKNGRWRIKVKKSRPFLGIAIEGGGNVTTQTQPRIISIHNDGAAVECADLHVGHIILEVDGNGTENLNHEQVAQMISRAYYNTPQRDYVEFLVREKNRNEFDLRRSSFMLLNNSFE